MIKLLKIELMSDLCISVGKHFSFVVDNDTALDEYGFPYIPSRCLKGCMKETAEYIGIADMKGLFGKSGENAPASLKVNNAFPADYREMKNAVMTENIHNEEVARLFCSVRQETAIDEENATAKSGTLRFTRVVNRYSPFSDEPMCFYAKVEYDDKYNDDMEKICKSLRNIGYHRNRGLGSVRCSLCDDTDGYSLKEYRFSDEQEYELSYIIHLDSDIMLSSSNSNHSTDYISGTAVLGALASVYKDTDFEELFLSNNVKFGNLYISDKVYEKENGIYEEKYIRYVPAPRFLAKIKAASEEQKGIKNMIGRDTEKPDGNAQTPPQYKPLKKGYIHQSYGTKEPRTKIVYHNSVNTSDSGLYMQYCLSDGQYYRGSITAKGKYLKKIYPLFSGGILRLGRSRTAQYSVCSLVKYDIKEYKTENLFIRKGEPMAYVLESDVILTDENGLPASDLYSLCRAMNINSPESIFSDECLNSVSDKTSVSLKSVAGYNAKWNLRKPRQTVYASGSAVVFNALEDMTVPKEFYIGEKQNEGYGKIVVIANADKYSVEEKDIPPIPPSQNQILSVLSEKRNSTYILSKAVANCEKLKINSSQTGRVMMMCKESSDYADFENRIESIKNETVRQHLQGLFSENVIKGILDIDEENESDLTWNHIRQYILNMLILHKYSLKKEEA